MPKPTGRLNTAILSACIIAIICLTAVGPVIADDQTPTCDYCGTSIASSYIVTDSGSYHESCYEDHIALRCAVCGQIIDGEYLIDYWGNTAHAFHKGDVPQCEYCNRFISDYTTGGGYRYRDGRFICRLCDNQAITDNDRALELMKEVSSILKMHGIEIDVSKIPLHLIDKQEMAKLRENQQGDPYGFTFAEKTTTAGGIVIRQDFKIYLLMTMPRLHFIATIAHELMHVWLYEHAPDDIDARLCEGSCNYASFLALQSYSGKDADYIRMTMHENPDHVYGEGFRGVEEFVREHDIDFWLEYLRENPDPPW